MARARSSYPRRHRHPLCRRRHPHAGQSVRRGRHGAGPRIAGCGDGYAGRAGQLRDPGLGQDHAGFDAQGAPRPRRPAARYAGHVRDRDQVDPVRHVIGSASAWGGNPETEAMYLNRVAPQNDGRTVYRVKVADVPVRGFWSISVYNSEGYYTPNDLNAYTINNLTATPATDGSVTVQFGGCDADAELPAHPGRLELDGAALSARGRRAGWQLGVPGARGGELTGGLDVSAPEGRWMPACGAKPPSDSYLPRRTRSTRICRLPTRAVAARRRSKRPQCVGPAGRFAICGPLTYQFRQKQWQYRFQPHFQPVSSLNEIRVNP